MGSEVLFHRDGVICTPLDPADPNKLVALLQSVIELYVLSFATIIHDTPWTDPIPVMIPPAGTFSPG